MSLVQVLGQPVLQQDPPLVLQLVLVLRPLLRCFLLAVQGKHVLVVLVVYHLETPDEAVYLV